LPLRKTLFYEIFRAIAHRLSDFSAETAATKRARITGNGLAVEPCRASFSWRACRPGFRRPGTTRWAPKLVMLCSSSRGA